MISRRSGVSAERRHFQAEKSAALGFMLACILWVAGCATGHRNPTGTDSASERATWMQQARWGVMVHYLADWKARDHDLQMSVEEWNRLVDGFDVEKLAAQLKSVGAGYLVLTVGQNSGYYLAPNRIYDRLVGVDSSRCSHRDLVFDMSIALRKRGIKLIAYLPSGAPSGDRTAREALQWQNGPHPNVAFQQKWERVIREWSLRWGQRIDGWWFDGCYWPNTMYRSKSAPNFESFAAAARAGNPRSAVAFNPGVVPRLISVTPHEDYVAGEISDPAALTIRRSVDGRLDGRQVHVLSYLGRTWGRGEPRFSTDQVLKWSRDVSAQRGAITWDVPVGLDGRISPPFLEQLSAIGRALSSQEIGTVR